MRRLDKQRGAYVLTNNIGCLAACHNSAARLSLRLSIARFFYIAAVLIPSGLTPIERKGSLRFMHCMDELP